MIVVLQKTVVEDLPSELTEKSFVNLMTTNNINFTRGCILQRNTILREIARDDV
jgi:hypothetical protein